jgi:hypothetical protein
MCRRNPTASIGDADKGTAIPPRQSYANATGSFNCLDCIQKHIDDYLLNLRRVVGNRGQRLIRDEFDVDGAG